MDKARDGTLEVQQRVQLDGCFRAAERRPIEQREAQIDGGGIERVDRGIEIEAKILVAVELAGAPDQQLRQIGLDTPVPLLVGIC